MGGHSLPRRGPWLGEAVGDFGLSGEGQEQGPALAAQGLDPADREVQG